MPLWSTEVLAGHLPNFPQSHRMQRVNLVAQHAVFDISSASMAENSHGVKPTLPTYLHSHCLIPQSHTFQAVVGLDAAEAVPDYIPRLNLLELIVREAY